MKVKRKTKENEEEDEEEGNYLRLLLPLRLLSPFYILDDTFDEIRKESLL